MSINVLVLESPRDRYALRLCEAFPALAISSAATVDGAGIALSDVDVLITFGIDDQSLRRATRLAWIQALSTGVDQYLSCPSFRVDTLLTNTRGIHGPAMRETVAFLMLALNRSAPRLLSQQVAHTWDRGGPWPLLNGQTAVIVGVGVVGTAIGGMLKSFGMTVFGVSHTLREIAGFDRLVTRDALREVVADADFLINVLPGGAENVGVIGTDVFAVMKASACLINVGRGETVDEIALISALSDGRLAGAGLDVFAEEPLPADSPLWEMPSVIVSPHIAGWSSGYEDAAMRIILDNMRLFLDGRRAEMHNIVPH